MARKYHERKSLSSAITTFLSSAGWTEISSVFDGFARDEQIVVPMVSLYFLPSHGIELQMGRAIDGSKSYLRHIQVDAYMESEARAEAIIDDLADFFDETTVTIVKPDNNAIGLMYCPNSEEIITNTLPPIMTTPKLLRWRGILKAPLEAHYSI